jgi:GT2 family glycosyltransferase
MDQRVKIIEWNHPFNYSQVNNWAARQVSGKVLLFLNNDIEVITPDWIEEMLMHAIRLGVGTVGAKLYFPNDTIQHAGVILGIGDVAGHGHKGFHKDLTGHGGQLTQIRNTTANTAACLMMRKEVFEQVNGFDENYILAYGDVDLCLKVLDAGYLNVWTPFAELYHHESKTRGYERSPEQLARYKNEVFYFKQRWDTFMHKGDPYYNPNLSKKREDFRLA